MAIKVKGVKKLKFNEDVAGNFLGDVGFEMKKLVEFHAPLDTKTLINHGVSVDYPKNGIRVFLDTEAVRNNYPDERQRNRPDGGNYPYYQEVGWTQHGVYHPGKLYWDMAFDITEYRAEMFLKHIYLDKFVTTK